MMFMFGTVVSASNTYCWPVNSVSAFRCCWLLAYLVEVAGGSRCPRLMLRPKQDTHADISKQNMFLTSKAEDFSQDAANWST